MRVLMFGWEFPPHISGGLGTACYGLTHGLVGLGVDILFVVPKVFGDEEKGLVSFIDINKVALKTGSFVRRTKEGKLSLLTARAQLVPYAGIVENDRESIELGHDHPTVSEINTMAQTFNFSGHYGKNYLDEVEKYALISSQIAKENYFDVIHAHDWLTYLAGITAKIESGKPLIVHVHATEFDRSGEKINPVVYEIEKRGMEMADKVITVSNLTRGIVIHRYGIDPAKVVTVYNGVLPKPKKEQIFLGKKIPEKIITFMGRVTFQKGPDYFVESAKKILDKCPNARFVMAGSGDMINRMIRRAAELRIGSRFHFTGFLKSADVDRLLAMTDVFVMPSVSEPFGIAPLEALQAGVPVIISKQSGVSEVLNNAIKVDFWDIDALTNAIYGLINYPSLSKNIAEYGKTETENLTWNKTADRIKQVYKSLLN